MIDPHTCPNPHKFRFSVLKNAGGTSIRETKRYFSFLHRSHSPLDFSILCSRTPDPKERSVSVRKTWHGAYVGHAKTRRLSGTTGTKRGRRARRQGAIAGVADRRGSSERSGEDEAPARGEPAIRKILSQLDRIFSAAALDGRTYRPERRCRSRRLHPLSG